MLIHYYHIILKPHSSFAICPVMSFIAKGSSTEPLAAFSFHVFLVSSLCPTIFDFYYLATFEDYRAVTIFDVLQYTFYQMTHDFDLNHSW